VAVEDGHLILVFFKTNDGPRGVAVGRYQSVAVADEREGALHGARCVLSRFASRRVDGVLWLVASWRGAPSAAAARDRSGG